MNVADFDDLAARLGALGGVSVEEPAQADIVLVNTCTVRAKAAEKAHSYFGELKHLKRGGGAAPLLVGMGCAVHRNRDEIMRRFPHLDLLIDFSDPDGVLDLLREHFPPLAVLEESAAYTPLLNPENCRQHFITAIRGCQHGCSFCIVPRARGQQRDVPLARIIAEAQRLEEVGAPDLTVLGQNILAYGATSEDGSPRFVEMMETLLAETGFRWITFLTSLACDLTDEICERIIAHPRITPLLHLPVQSGSDHVLSDMKRGHDVAHFRRMVRKARACRQDLYLTTDLLVGFPSESEEDFQATLELARDVGFDDAFMFAYSERPGTLAAEKYEDSLPRAEKMRRLNELIAKQREWGGARNRRFLGQELSVIIERQGNEKIVARTAFNKPVYLDSASAAVGTFCRVLITGVRISSLTGEEVAGAP
jgi:tRNA-2-methylthio-N6-dimethylallyladenosine synthase